ncbi:UNKNOWN [Stylonychia lemnae]|uniref:Uncharacterized protein n=1 Tax=Stylonychia lemnae TaxID=5949 RepID=A0A078AJX9_STYLE|nr:UNKNOWN [Stylonychia lemnae]|eukprot:CDW81767.1 UNKNOWN [Stylonychia lemnae]
MQANAMSDPYGMNQIQIKEYSRQKNQGMNLKRAESHQARNHNSSLSVYSLPGINNNGSNTSFSETESVHRNGKRGEVAHHRESSQKLNDSYGDYIRKKELFGIDGYKVPSNKALIIPPRTFKLVKSEKQSRSFVDVEVKNRQFMPPPNYYQTPSDWKKQQNEYLYGGSPLKGKFLKGNRVTLSAEIINQNKKESMPGPGSYDSAQKQKLTGLYKVKEEKSQFIDDAKYFGLQTPGAIYNPKVEYVKPRIITTKVYADKKDKDDTKIKKSDAPCPGQYDVENSYAKTQWTSRVPQFTKRNHKSFIDIYKKSRDFLPGVGSYQNMENGFNKLSFNPPSIRTKRH